jgi:hypothetical protein
MVVGPVESPRRTARFQPAEELLVPFVHPKRDLRLAAVTPEVPLADQEPDQEAGVEAGDAGAGSGDGRDGSSEAIVPAWCFTVKFLVKHEGRRRSCFTVMFPGNIRGRARRPGRESLPCRSGALLETERRGRGRLAPKHQHASAGSTSRSAGRRGPPPQGHGAAGGPRTGRAAGAGLHLRSARARAASRRNAQRRIRGSRRTTCRSSRRRARRGRGSVPDPTSMRRPASGKAAGEDRATGGGRGPRGSWPRSG